jgi:ABC-type multidrug transport system fused ATPase/permease subunit
VGDYIVEVLKKRAQVNLWGNMYRKLLECPQLEIDKNAPGEYISRTLSDTQFVGSIIGAYFPSITMNLVTFISNILATALLSPILTLMILSATPFYYILYSKQAKYMVSSTAEERNAYSALMESLRVKIEAIRSIKNLNIGENMTKLFRRDSESWYKKIKKVIFVEKRYAFTFNFLRNVIPLSVLGAGIYLAITGLISLGTLVAFFYFSLSFFNPLVVLCTDLGSLAQAVPPVQRVESILTLPSEKSGEKPLDIIKNVTFRNVSFSYDGYVPTIKNVTFTIYKGEKVAIVGESGSGKTTLLSLMNRTYEPSEGEIRLNEETLKKYELKSLRQKIMLISLKDIIFPGTIKENITLYDDNYSEKDLIWAADIAGVTEDFPSLDVSIGPGMKDVSEGQRQKICLARAIIRKPDILLLDEALSSVDSRIEEKIMGRLLNDFADRTIIVVSHRLSTVLSMSKILVMKKGEIVAEGKFEDLNKSCKEFISLMKRQIIR